MNRDEFISMMLPHAMEASARTGVDPRIIIAQGALESAWGKKAPGNNYFGIKSHGKGGGQTFATTEVYNGKAVKIRDSFRQYANPGESVQGYADFLLQNKRYRPMLEAQGLDAQIAALGRSGYATDPNYANKISSIASGISLNGMPAAPPAAAAPVQPGMGAPNWKTAVETQAAKTPSIAAPAQPGMGAPNWSNAVDEAGGAPFPLAPQGGVTPTPTPTEAAPEDDYLSQIAGMDLSGAYGPKAGAPGGRLSGGRGPTIDQITATLLKQRKQGAPMPFGLFPGA
jgi:hypothetical protein